REHHRYRRNHLHIDAMACVVLDACLRVPGIGPDLAEEPAFAVDAVAAVIGVVDHREAWIAVLPRQVRPVPGQHVRMDIDDEHAWHCSRPFRPRLWQHRTGRRASVLQGALASAAPCCRPAYAATMEPTMRHPALAFLLTLWLFSGGPVMSVHAQSPTVPAISSDGTLLSVAARAEARRAPDVATLSVGVVTQAEDSADAMRGNAAQMNRVMQAIRRLDIAEKDIRTSGVHLSPQYRYRQNEPPVITEIGRAHV